MTKLSLPEISMEAISYQGRSMLLFDLISAVETFRATVPPLSIHYEDFNLAQAAEAFARLNLTGIVEKRTGMKINFSLDPDSYISCEPAVLDANNPFFKVLKTGLFDPRPDALSRFQRAVRLAQDVQGWVDPKTAKVGGLFSSLHCRMFVGLELIANEQFSSEEVAALILHELGHLFSFFETLGYTTASNMVVITAMDALRGIEDETQRFKLISQATSAFKAKPDPELFETKSDETVKVLLLKTIEQAEQDRVAQLAAGREHRYNYRSIEFMADQYAVRMGAAVPLATVQHKMAKMHLPNYGISRSSFLAFQAARMALLGVTFLNPVGMFLGPLTLLSCTLILASQAKDDDGQSDPIEMLGLISRDLVQLLKNPKLDGRKRKQLHDDLEAVNQLRSEVQHHHGIMRYIWRNVLPSGRRQAKAREIEKSIEDLVNNQLFVHASRLRSA